jgi:hypothetical protein
MFFCVLIDRTVGALCIDMRSGAFCNITAEAANSRLLSRDLCVRFNNTHITSSCADAYFPFYECICEQIIHNSIYIKLESEGRNNVGFY